MSLNAWELGTQKRQKLCGGLPAKGPVTERSDEWITLLSIPINEIETGSPRS